MTARPFVDDYLAHVIDVLQGNGTLLESLEAAKDAFERVGESGGKAMFAGNGASASMASHYALDFTKQASIPAISFNDAPLLTAYANDYGYENWVARAMDHHGQPGDIAVLISSSGRSANVLNAADFCRDRGIGVVTFTGFDKANPLRLRSDIGFWVESRAYNVIESVHALWLGLLCDLLIGKREYDVTG